MKYEEYLKSRDLRKRGWSVRSIAVELGVSRGSVSKWVRDIDLTENQKERLFSERPQQGLCGDDSPIRQKHLKIREGYKLLGRELYENHKNEPLFICGISLYWAEGTKKRNEMAFSNSDPAMMALFLKFLKKYFDVKKEDTKFKFHTHKDNKKSLESILDYWKNLLDLDDENVNKEYVDQRQVSGRRGRKNTLHNGIATIRVYSTEKIQMLYGAIEEMAKSESVSIDKAKWID